MFQTLMGVFYYIGAVALLEDLPLGENHHSIDAFIAEVKSGYSQVSVLIQYKFLVKCIVLKITFLRE